MATPEMAVPRRNGGGGGGGGGDLCRERESRERGEKGDRASSAGEGVPRAPGTVIWVG